MKKTYEPREDFTRYGLLSRAAYYFFLARKPRAAWKHLDDLTAQLAEFDLRCAARDYNNAANVIKEIDYDYLLLWGHYRLLIELHLHVKEKITSKDLQINNFHILGLVHNYIGKIRKSVEYCQQGLDIARDTKNRLWEGTFLNNLGLNYAALGDIRKAIEYYEQALIIAREVGDRKGEGDTLNNLGVTYSTLGNVHKAIEFYEQVLLIDRKIGDRRGEGSYIGNLGNCYSDLGDARKAIEYYEQALVIARQIGDLMGQSTNLENTGRAFISLENYQKAQGNYQQAIQIADEISSPMVQLNARWELAQIYLFQNDLVNARATIEAALQYDVPQNNHNATALHGIIALRQGERETAQEAFIKSIAQADEILAKTPDYYSALDAKGLALCGEVVSGKWEVGSRERDEVVAEAVKTFKRAREIAPHAGVIKSVLRLFDELVKCDEEGMLKDVRDAVEGKS